MKQASAVSDWRALSLLLERGAEALDPYLLYKACIAFAINGNQHTAESLLTGEYRTLLEARRLINNLKLSPAGHILENQFLISDEHSRYFELLGDKEYLLALIAHRTNDPELSSVHFERASSFHSQGKDQHRALRSLINQKIVVADLKSHINGELFFLKQKAFSLGFFDLVGNIEKGAASEWLVAGNHFEAERSARAAVESYQLDGCPEDRAVAVALLGISLMLANNLSEAKSVRSTISIKDGKNSSYVRILDALLDGKIPEVSSGHPLAPVEWKLKIKPKENSVPGRILQKLIANPMDRDQLIREIWGAEAIDPSYCGRLYTAIKELRRKYGVAIEFDGQSYRIGS